ncbi:MAG TPA: hypothetical protein VG184_04960 [Acidimicrobiales bacterium]|jgi:hypothetical protein|nr:hypothetical protein [Acidimicrobiales bacterium]
MAGAHDGAGLCHQRGEIIDARGRELQHRRNEPHSDDPPDCFERSLRLHLVNR